MGPRVAIVLVHHADYAAQHFAECFASLSAQRFPPERIGLFIVNNGATAASQQRVAELAPTAHHVILPRNRGWAAGNNAAIRIALDEGFEYLVMLNMDTTLDPGWLAALVDEADRRPDVHILQSKILVYGTTRINSIGTRTQYLGYTYCAGFGRDGRERCSGIPIDGASGASMLVKRAVFETVGLFRADYFIYYDDVEFSWRARLAGYNVGLAEASICHHKYDPQNTVRLLYYVERNRLVTMLTLEQMRTLLLIAPCLLVVSGLMSLYYFFAGRADVLWKLLRHFLQAKTWRLITVRRRRVRQLRVRDDAEIVGGFAGGVMIAAVNSRWLPHIANPPLTLYWWGVRALLMRPWRRAGKVPVSTPAHRSSLDASAPAQTPPGRRRS